jgi:hypothetical protein
VKAPHSEPLRPMPPPSPVAIPGNKCPPIPRCSLKLKEIDSAQL